MPHFQKIILILWWCIISDGKQPYNFIYVCPRKYFIKAVWSCLKGIDCAVAPKTMMMKTLNGLHHEPQTYQEQ